MNLKDWLTAIGVAIELVGAMYYLWTIPKGDTRPQPISWAGWTAIGVVGTWAAYSGGAGRATFIAASFVLVTAAIFAVSLIPGYGHKGTDKPEPTDLPILIAGIVLLVLRALNVFPPSLHVSLAVLGDLCFAWFTLRKAWIYPETENLVGWLAAVVAAGLGLAVIGSYSYTALVFPLYIFVGNTAIAAAIVISRRRQTKQHTKKSRG
jgi:hypothetical protein